METSGESKKRIMAIVTVSLFLTAGIVLFTADYGGGALSDESDNFGYRYMDNNDPEPKVEYDWFDASGGDTVSDDLSSSYSSTSVDLPWDFTFYGETYDRIWVQSKGYLTFSSQSTSSGSSSYNIPTSSGPDHLIAVYWGYPYADYNSYGPIYYAEDPAGKFVCVEWNVYSDLNFEVLLYKNGMIKMQYADVDAQSSSYTQGSNHIVGIENEAGSDGLAYSDYNDQNLFSGEAIVFSAIKLAYRDMVLVNGDGEDEATCYAEHRYYEFRVKVSDSLGRDDISYVEFYFGKPSRKIGVKYVQGEGGGEFNYLSGSSSHLELDETHTNVFNPINETSIEIVLKIKFKFSHPDSGMVDVTLYGSGESSLPALYTMEDMFYLETEVDLDGEFQILGNDDRLIENGGFTMENESIELTGVMLVYNNTYGDIYPPNSSFYISAIDEVGSEITDMNASARNISISFNMPVKAVMKEFTLSVMRIPNYKFLGNFEVVELNVDNSKPPAPLNVQIHADSYKDQNMESDNDDIVYVTWSRVVDIGSGVLRYRISDDYNPDKLDEAPYVDDKTSEFMWNGTEHGELNIYVWAEDEVGHHGDVKVAKILIDKKNPTWDSDSFRPLRGEWIKSLTPTVTINSYDEGAGVSGESIEYSISTNGTDDFEEWINAEIYDEGGDVPVKINPRFIEGENNWIRFRMKDVAGNGYILSDNFSLKIDVTEVSFSNMFPTQDVWHNLNVVNSREIEVYLSDETSGIDTAQMYYRISIEEDEKGDPIWETGIQQTGGWVKYSVGAQDRIDGNKLVRLHFPFDKFQEGENNIIQFRAKDIAGNGEDDGWTLSDRYVVKVNTRPEAHISAPEEGQVFDVNERITFDASGSFDIDLDKNNLKYEWKEGNATLGRGEVLENQRFTIQGKHTITLYVGDSAHRYDPITGIDTRATAVVNITIFRPVISWDEDTDGDGMVDGYEAENQLDMNDPKDANEDPDRDGYTNLEEYLGIDNNPPRGKDDPNNDGTDPWDIQDRPKMEFEGGDKPVDPAPFDMFWFVIILVITILIAAIVVTWGYLRMNREESKEKQQEAEEDAMLVTPQLEIPSMPQMPDTSVPTLPTAQTQYDESSALPPAQQPEGMEQQPPVQGEQPQPMEGEPMQAQPQTVEGQEQYPQQPQAQQPPQQQENPMYESGQEQQQNPTYQG